MTEPHNYVKAQLAPSGRAKCRGCKANIDKDTLRMAVCFEDSGMVSTPWNHFQCFYLPKKYIEDDLQPSAIQGYHMLSEADKLRLEDRIVKLKSGQIAKGKSGKKKNTSKGGKGGSGEVTIEPEDPKKYKPGGYTADQRKEFEQYKQEYGKFTVKQLQAMLGYNKQIMKGTRDEVLDRVADGWLLGSIPNCPKCEKGKMEFNRFDGTYKCKGYFDDEEAVYKRCGKKYKRDEIERDQFA